MYERAVKAFGKDKVGLFNRPYQLYSSFCKENMAESINSMALYTREIRRNPDIKIIVVVVVEAAMIIVCDPEMIRKIIT
jgi:hypothetical protein